MLVVMPELSSQLFVHVAVICLVYPANCALFRKDLRVPKRVPDPGNPIYMAPLSLNPRVSCRGCEYGSRMGYERSRNLTGQLFEPNAPRAQQAKFSTEPGFALQGTHCQDFRRCFQDDIDNKASSVRLTGLWMFYSSYSFGLEDTTTKVEWAWGEDIIHEFSDALDGDVSSARFVGDMNDFSLDTVTLFTGSFFTSWEYFIPDDMEQTPQWQYPLHSVVITGSSPWTLYTQKGYTGASACLYPGQQQNPGLYPTAAYLGNTAGWVVKSVRRGCHATTQLRSINADERNSDDVQRQYQGPHFVR